MSDRHPDLRPASAARRGPLRAREGSPRRLARCWTSSTDASRRPRCPFRCPIHDHSASLNVIYGGKKPQLNVCFDHAGLRWITKSVHWKSACRQFNSAPGHHV